jgi:DNA repair protein RecN (Recombination protein N)
MHRQLESAAAIDGDLTAPAKQVAELTYQVEDIVEALRRYLRRVDSDDHRLEEVEARLDTLNRLKRKYGGGALDEVFAKYDAVTLALADLDHLGGQLDSLDQQLAAGHERLAAAARKLHGQRLAAAERLAGDMARELDSLHMPGTRFAVNLEPVPSDGRTPTPLTVEGARVDERGMDKAAFMMAPNVGEDLKPLAAIASGGELSRVVLALKAILAASEALETVIFDEVDAGIGGGVAEIVGQKLRTLAAHHQVICITHLPQIAQFGDHHFKIAKAVHQGRTRTSIAPLDADERLEELARMLGGIKITQRTRDHAREMLARKRSLAGCGLTRPK